MRLPKLFTLASVRDIEPSLADINVDLRDISAAIELVDGFPRIRWPAVHAAMAPHRNNPRINRIWTEMAAQWLVLVGNHIGKDYKLYESDRLLFMSNLPSLTRRLAAIGDAAFDRLERLLRSSASERGFGKHAVIIFDGNDAYYDYISYFHPQREQPFGRTAGMHIGAGYSHTVLLAKTHSVDRTLVHELSHNMVMRRPMPLWLNEGLAQYMEDMVPGDRAPLIDHRQVRLHRRYWSWFGINHFWDGSSFRSVSSQRLSYQLSEILFRNLVSDRTRGKRLHDFMETAHRDDAGAAACLRCFGRPLSALVEEFLGPGDWKCSPEADRPHVHPSNEPTS